ncbi:MAG: DUF3048 domain-containing protein [Anaerolineales bacterium]
MRVKLTSLLLLLIFVTACGSGTSTPSANATPTAPLIVTSAVTSAPEATSTTAPTLLAPTAVIVTPETVQQYGPENFPPDVNPLTGLKVADPAVLERRPLALKVSQFPRRVRPQFGLSLADLVWEHYAEAGVTRMTALYLGNDSPKLGSIRSARLIDTVITEGYKAILVTSGSSEGTLNRLARTNFFDRVIAEATGFNKCPPLCREGDISQSTDLLFANTQDLWDTATGLGLNTRQDLRGMAFFPDPPAGGAPATTVHLDFQVDNNVTEWRYDSSTARYARWVDTSVVGELAPHTDAVNGQQLTAANVVVVYANHVTTDIVEDFADGGHCGYEIQVWSSGPARLFRDGQAYDLTWVRFANPDLVGFVGADGAVFPFKPGNTWFEVLNLNSPTDFANGAFTARFRGPSQSQGCPVGAGN